MHFQKDSLVFFFWLFQHEQHLCAYSIHERYRTFLEVESILLDFGWWWIYIMDIEDIFQQ